MDFDLFVVTEAAFHGEDEKGIELNADSSSAFLAGSFENDAVASAEVDEEVFVAEFIEFSQGVFERSF